jgi:hypothetical protein
MSTHASKPRSLHELVGAVQTTRDRARVQLHLLSMDAKDRYRELEGKLVDIEHKLQAGGERVVAEASATVDELTHAVGELFSKADSDREASAERSGR